MQLRDDPSELDPHKRIYRLANWLAQQFHRCTWRGCWPHDESIVLGAEVAAIPIPALFLVKKPFERHGVATACLEASKSAYSIMIISVTTWLHRGEVDLECGWFL